MTSTTANVGLSDNTRLSSRVLRPPGGGHTDIFGGEPEPPRTGRRQACNITGSSAPDTSAPVKPESQEPEQNGQANAEAPPSEQVQETANEVPKGKIEAVASEPTKTEPQKPSVEPTRRVRVPPGGFSSGLW